VIEAGCSLHWKSIKENAARTVFSCCLIVDYPVQVDILLRLYRNWQHSSDVHAVVVKGAGGKVLMTQLA